MKEWASDDISRSVMVAPPTGAQHLSVLEPFDLHVGVADRDEATFKVRRLRLDELSERPERRREDGRPARLLDEHVVLDGRRLDAVLDQLDGRRTLDGRLAGNAAETGRWEDGERAADGRWEKGVETWQRGDGERREGGGKGGGKCEVRGWVMGGEGAGDGRWGGGWWEVRGVCEGRWGSGWWELRKWVMGDEEVGNGRWRSGRWEMKEWEMGGEGVGNGRWGVGDGQ